MNYFIILCLIFLISCSGSKTVTKKDEDTESKYDESFDPLTLNDNDITFPTSFISEDEKTNTTSTTSNKEIQPELREVNGFRVQIIATQDLEKATLLEEEAKNHFLRQGYNTYLVFEAPLYKIRIGDFTNRDNADELKDKALSYGYRESFIVKTKVIPNKNTEF